MLSLQHTATTLNPELDPLPSISPQAGDKSDTVMIKTTTSPKHPGRGGT